MEKRIYWEPLVSAGAVLIAIFGVMVPLFIHSDNNSRALVEAIRADIGEYNKEMRDFHGRLCSIEERRK